MSRQKCQDQAGHLCWLHPMHLMHQPQMTAAPHSLLATLPLLSEAISLENKEEKRTVLLPARLSFQDHGRKKLGHTNEREREGPSFLYGALRESQESHMCQAFFVCLRKRVYFPDVPVASPFFSKVTVEAGRQASRQAVEAGRQKYLTPVSYPFLTGQSQDAVQLRYIFS